MLILESLEISNFRALRQLRLARLGQVNLIVGKNNIGKSSVLEALWLYAQRGAPSAIWEVIEARSEGRRPRRRVPPPDRDENRILALKHLFHGRQDIREDHQPIEIGPIDRPRERLSIDITWADPESPNSGQQTFLPELMVPYLVIRLGPEKPLFYRLDRDQITSRSGLSREQKPIHAVLVNADGLDIEQMANLWDEISLTPREDDIVEALRIIAPEVDRVNLIAGHDRTWERMPIVKIREFENPVPLKSMGDGMNRLFGITLALVNAREGLLLIDEVENGLHYSVQSDVWRLIFQLARRLNVQVFATSHSWDCIDAFQKAGNEDPQAEGLLVRMEKGLSEQVEVTLFDEEKLAIAAREKIEVR